MSASIAHMLIAKKAMNHLKQDKQADGKIAKFVEEIITPHQKYFLLGSLGPDMPYFQNILKSVVMSLRDKPNIPMGVEKYSYQLHSKDPNIFPLKMLEVTWKESDINKNEWEEIDKMRLAFVCGYLCHMATDHIIHPLIQKLAGPYYKRKNTKVAEQGSREIHRHAEVCQDLYLLMQEMNADKLSFDDFKKSDFPEWCHIVSPFHISWKEKVFRHPRTWANKFMKINGPLCSDELVYLLQKSFVEAHSITPKTGEISAWVDGTIATLRFAKVSLGGKTPYSKAHNKMFSADGMINKESIEYSKFIKLNGVDNGDYNSYVKNAVELSSIYLKAAFIIYDADQLDDDKRKKFTNVVRNADLTYPLDKDILNDAKTEC